MPTVAANLTMLFTEVPFLDRFERAARAGFRFVEVQFPYAHRPDEIKARLDAHGLSLVLHNLPAGDWDGGERGLACLPGREAEFREGVARALRYAAALGVPRLNCLAGITPQRTDPALVHRTLVENLRYAAGELAAAGIQMVVEPLNTFDVPGAYLSRLDQALAVFDDAGAENLFVQFDLYHAQRMHGELAATMERHLARIGHMQVADNPGRHEPGTGEINYPFLFSHIDKIGYAGFVGAEYWPAEETESGLGWWRALA
jgi:hydroxypyruvate isomerase